MNHEFGMAKDRRQESLAAQSVVPGKEDLLLVA
jgi:hypothetical protein